MSRFYSKWRHSLSAEVLLHTFISFVFVIYWMFNRFMFFRGCISPLGVQFFFFITLLFLFGFVFSALFFTILAFALFSVLIFTIDRTTETETNIQFKSQGSRSIGRKKKSTSEYSIQNSKAHETRCRCIIIFFFFDFCNNVMNLWYIFIGVIYRYGLMRNFSNTSNTSIEMDDIKIYAKLCFRFFFLFEYVNRVWWSCYFIYLSLSFD